MNLLESMILSAIAATIVTGAAVCPATRNVAT